MPAARFRRRYWALLLLVLGVAFLGAVYVTFRGDVIQYSLDPKVPFQTYRPPPAPDYATREAWALMPERPDVPTPEEPAADIFFLPPTTYAGGREWNAPYNDGAADREFHRV